MSGNNVKAKIAKIFHQPAPADGVPDVEFYSLYGAGQLGQLCLDLIRQMGKKVSCVWDQDDKRARTFMESNSIYPISRPDPKVAQEPVIVCVSKVPIAKLFSDLETQGFTRLINFYDFANRFADRTGFTNGWRFDSISTKQIADLTLLAERFTDTQSVVHCLEFLTWHRLRRASGLKSFDPDIGAAYFPEFITRTLHDHETFVDIGAHKGGVMIKFHNIVAAKFYKNIGIEPDPMNILEALRAIGAVDPRMHLIAGGIGRNRALTKYVIGNGYRSAAGAGGNILIPEFTLDSLDLEPTFIKLHIEGREAAALESGKNTLTRCRPIIAATVYHERDNLLETGNFLFEHLQNYGYFFRCHSYIGTGAIIYAVPYERHLGNHRE